MADLERVQVELGEAISAVLTRQRAAVYAEILGLAGDGDDDGGDLAGSGG